MNITDQILQLIDHPENKTIVEIGAHEDSETRALAQHFKHVYSYYEFLKIPDREEDNITIKKIPYLEILDQLQNFDVILLENEFHHFPDVWQMQTYDKLTPNQNLFLVEWDFTGSTNDFYHAFQNCRPLCELTREILQKFVKNGYIKIQKQMKGKFEDEIHTPEEMIAHFQFQLPDHWRYGEKEFREKIRSIQYPITLWEGYDIFAISRN